MKKRILALALAGTTAFSVFGAAMSASAIQQTAEATVTLKDGKVVYYYTDDAYLPYDNVAKTISTTAFAAASSTHTYYDVTTGTGKVVADEDSTDATYPSVAEYNKTIAKKDDYTPYLYTISKNGSYLNYDKDGNLYLIASYGAKAEKITEDADIVAAVAPFGIAPTAPQENSNEKWVIADKKNATYKTLAEAISDAASLTGVTKNTDAKHVLLNGEVEVLKAGDDNTAAGYSANNIDDAVFNKLPDNDAAYKESNIKVLESTVVAGSGANAMVVVNHGNKLNGGTAFAAYDKDGNDTAATVASQTGWVFTSQDTSAEITPYTLDSQSYLNSDKSGYYIVTTAVDNNTVYAYDFVPAANGNVANASAGSIAWNWNYGTVTATAATFGNAWVAEDGRGTPGIGVRYGVVSDWLDFLDELGINHDGTDHYVEDFEEFKDNYWDLFYLDNVYSEKTGLLKGYEYVDLYNIQELLHDIYEYSYKSEWSKANTSELVYLMQQYNKYIGDYISTAEVANDDWGDLLLSILDAATEADFKNAKEYKKYTNKVTSLRDAYEEATTTAQIYRAEADMYDLLTNYGAYGYTAKGDFSDARKELGAAINGLYFNATTKSSTGNVIPTYTTEAATQDKTYAKYTNYEYLVAASKTSYSAGKDSSITFSVNKAAGYYSLYPMADYIDWDTATPNEPYAGNSMFDDFAGYATEEYEWFWNVYQLAANMYNNIAAKGNHYTGSIEAVIDALADAVEDMNTLTTASKTATAAVEELEETYNKKQQGFVVTGEVSKDDFDAGYYGMYEEAVAYADVFTGKAQAEVAANIMKVAGESLTYQGTQTVVTKNDMKAVESAIAEGEKALKALVGEEYNAAQVNALNKAVSQAKNLLALYEGEYATYSGAQSVDHSYTTAVRDKDQMLKSDLAEAIAAIDDAINYSEIVMGWNNTADGWTYGTEDGYLNDGWHKIGSVWYYFDADNTAKQSEWMQEDGKWYWFNSNCGAAIGWAKVEGEWYYFGGDNAMKTGWQKVDGNWYYLAASGKMTTGWVQVDGKWYYMSKESNSLGQMLANTTVEGYKLGADGAMIEK